VLSQIPRKSAATEDAGDRLVVDVVRGIPPASVYLGHRAHSPAVTRLAVLQPVQPFLSLAFRPRRVDSAQNPSDDDEARGAMGIIDVTAIDVSRTPFGYIATATVPPFQRNARKPSGVRASLSTGPRMSSVLRREAARSAPSY
jgi:hypothetical protein